MKEKKGGKIIIPVVMATWLIISLLSLFGSLESMEMQVYDAWFRMRGPMPQDERLAIVGIDDASISEIGSLPWPRHIWVDLLDRLGKARTVGFDFLFDTITTPDADDALAQAVAEHGRVVLASDLTFVEDQREVYQAIIEPIPPLQQAALATGFVNVPQEKDNVVRRAMPVELNLSGGSYPSFALALALAAGEQGVGDIRLEGRQVVAEDVSLPLDSGYQMLLNFPGPARTIPTYSLIDVLEGRVDAGSFEDRIVLLGTTSSAEKDVFDTPFTRGNLVLRGLLPVPGVELHAAAVSTYLDGSFFTRAGTGINLLFLLLAGIATALLAHRHPWRGLAGALGLVVVIALSAGLLWRFSHFWLNAVGPSVNVAATFLVVTSTNLALEQRDRRFLRQLFGRYVSSGVVNELLEHPELTALGGRKLEATVMFVDIRGFTSYSEGRPPEDVVSRLNVYLEAMTQEVFSQGGMLDKYTGDGLMAIFGAPIPTEEHARQALAASRVMLRRIDELNEEQSDQLPLNIGIGLNSGPIVVGNIGSHDRMDYTAIGEDVNLSARLESVNKEKGTSIIVGDRCLPYLGDDTKLLRYLGEVEVKGFTMPIPIYTLDPEALGQ